jgi:hypothetical protein
MGNNNGLARLSPEAHSRIVGHVGPGSSVNVASRRLELLHRRRRALDAANAAGYGGLRPDASPKQVRRTYLWGNRYMPEVERELRPGRPQQPNDQFFDSKLDSRDPNSVAAFHRAAQAGRLGDYRQLSYEWRTVIQQDPGLIRAYVNAPHAGTGASSAARHWSLVNILSSVKKNKSSKCLRALIRSRENPNGLDATTALDPTIRTGSREAVKTVLRRLSRQEIINAREEIRESLFSRHKLLNDPGSVDDILVSLLGPDILRPPARQQSNDGSDDDGSDDDGSDDDGSDESDYDDAVRYNTAHSQLDRAHALLRPASKSATDVTRAYRAAALRTHPDRGGSNQAFRQVSQAFDVLKGATQQARQAAALRASRRI